MSNGYIWAQVHLRQEVLLAIESPAEVAADGEEIQEVALRPEQKS